MFVFMPWDPVRDLLTMQERLESLFGRATPGWVPAVDLSEVGDRYVLTIEVPGLRRDDVNIEVQDGTVTLRGRRPGQSCCPERYQQLERAQGSFSRTFRFAVPIAPDGITAELADGVLTVSIPKAESSSTRVEVA